MPGRQVELRFPFRGVNKNEAVGDQPAETTRVAKNARGRDPATGSRRGSSRGGHIKYSPERLWRNLLGFSSKTANSAWTKSTTGGGNPTTVSEDAGIGVDGVSVTADRVTGTKSAVGNEPFLFQDIPAFDKTFTSGDQVRCLWGRLKPETSTGCVLIATLVGSSPIVRTRLAWNWVAGNPVFVSITSSGLGVHDFGFVPLGNGFWQIFVTITASVFGTVATALRCELAAERANGTTGSVLVDGFQCERGGTPTAYQDIVGAQLAGADDAVRGLGRVVYVGQTTAFSAIGNPFISEDASAKSDFGDAKALQQDEFGNIYAIEGRGTVTKRNATGQLLWSLALPLQDTSHELGALVLSNNELFAAVTTTSLDSADQSKTRVYRVVQSEDNTATQAWKRDIDSGGADEGFAVGGYVTALVATDELLYVVRNKPDRWRSDVLCLADIRTAGPREVWASEVPYPANGLARLPSGDLVLTCEKFIDRGKDPQYAGMSLPLTFWKPTDLPNGLARIWTHFDARDLTLADAAPVLRVVDKSGHQRDLFYLDDGVSAHKPPTLRKNALGAQQGIHFDGVASFLTSLSNSSLERAQSDQQKSVLPAYIGSKFSVFAMIRPANKATMGMFLNQNNPASGANFNRSILLNRNSGSGVPGAVGQGQISVFEQVESGGGGGNGHPQHGTFAGSKQDVALIAYHIDAGQPDLSLGYLETSVLRINGVSIDTFKSKLNEGLVFTEIGHSVVRSAFGFGEFDLLEMVVFGGGYLQEGGGLDNADPLFPEFFAVPPITEAEMVEGYLAHGWGVSHLLPALHPYATSAPVVVGKPDRNNLRSTNPMVLKMSGANGDLLSFFGGLNSPVFGGIGQSIAAGPVGEIYCAGPANVPADSATVRRLIDLGSSFTDSTSDGAWSASGPNYRFPRPGLGVDAYGNLFVPSSEITASVPSVRAYSPTGSVLWDYFAGSTFNSNLGQQRAYAVAAIPVKEEYGTSTVTIAKNVVVGLERTAHDGSASGLPALRRLKLVNAAPTNVAARQVRTLAAARGSLLRFDATGSALVAGGASMFHPDATTVTMAEAFEKLYITDGLKVFVYDPRTDAVVPWVATNGGQVPDGFALLDFWRGRALLARGATEPQNWYMSKQGDPLDFDTAPPGGPFADQATFGRGDFVGRIPDVITALIPFSDDVLIWGCDHQIWQLTGDPLAGGRLDNLSQVVGMAYGTRPWCRTRQGAIFFADNLGGVQVIAPGSGPRPLTLNTIERDLESIDLGRYEPRMEWNSRTESVHLFLIPRTAGDAQIGHWVYDLRDRAWWPDSFANVGHNPSATLVIDGDDAEDRHLVLGCVDGFVRAQDDAAKNDDGVAIHSRVRIGPIAPPTLGVELLYTQLDIVLGARLGGANFVVLTSDSPDGPLSECWKGEIQAGRNGPLLERARGSYIWLEISSASKGSGWALESATVMAYPAGIRRRVNL